MPIIDGTSIEYEEKRHDEITSAYSYAPFVTAWKQYEYGVAQNPVCKWNYPTQTIHTETGDGSAYADILWLYDPEYVFPEANVLINANNTDTLNVITKLDIQQYKLKIKSFRTLYASDNGVNNSINTRSTGYILQTNENIVDVQYCFYDKDTPETEIYNIYPVIRYNVNGETWYFRINTIFSNYIRNVPTDSNKLTVQAPDGYFSPHNDSILLFHSPVACDWQKNLPSLNNAFLCGGNDYYNVVFNNVSNGNNSLYSMANSIETMLKIFATLGIYFDYNGTMYLGYMDSTGQTTGDYLTEDKWSESAQWESVNINNFTEHTSPVVPPVSITDKETEMPLAYIGGNAGMVTFYEINKTGLASADDISDAISRFDIAQIGKDLLRNFISFKAFAAIRVDDTVDRQIKIAGIGLEDSGGHALTGRVIGGVKPIDLFPTSSGVTIPTLYNDYRDYEPYTKIQMYVPFCGWFSLPSWCIGKKITGTMFTDLYNGTVKAVIYASDTVVAEVGGCCAYDIPFVADATGMKAGAVISSALTTAAAVGAAVTMPNVATGIAAVSAAANLAATLNGSDTTLKGVLGDGSNLNGLLHVYIKVSRPKSPNGSTNIPDSYKHEIGIPTMREVTISAGDGFIQVMDAKVTGTMTAREKQMIVDGFRHGLNF